MNAADNNWINDNDIDYNDNDGIVVNNSDFNNIENNIVNYNHRGVMIRDNSKNNNITNNNQIRNNDYGVHLILIQTTH